MLNVYADFFEKDLGMPVLRGQKTDKEKFAGAKATYTVEALMHDGKALQGGTSHNFGTGFAEAFGIQFLDSDNTLKYAYETSWGVSTRIIGGIIMTHGDDNGLVLPPSIAPIQVVIIPVAAHKEGVTEAAESIYNRLRGDFRTKLDDSDNSPGWKYAEYEMKGIPLRIEIGPRDMEAGQCVLVTRHNREKTIVKLEELEKAVAEKLQAVHDGMYEKALANRESRTYTCETIDEINAKLAENGDGFVRAMWCGDPECEDKVKEMTGVGSRCIPMNQEIVSDKCVCCGRPAKKLVYWGKAY